MTRCNEKVEVFSRVVGYFRPVSRWNDGKKEEFKERKTFKVKEQVIKKPRWVNANKMDTLER